jgi:hypothetical protein
VTNYKFDDKPQRNSLYSRLCSAPEQVRQDKVEQWAFRKLEKWGSLAEWKFFMAKGASHTPWRPSQDYAWSHVGRHCHRPYTLLPPPPTELQTDAIVFSFSAIRRPNFYLTSVFFVYAAVTVFGFFSFAVPTTPEKVDTRLSIIASLLLALISARLTVFTFTPRVHSLTNMDLYAIWCIIILLVMGFQAAVGPWSATNLDNIYMLMADRGAYLAFSVLTAFWGGANVWGFVYVSSMTRFHGRMVARALFDIGLAFFFDKGHESSIIYCCSKSQEAADEEEARSKAQEGGASAQPWLCCVRRGQSAAAVHAQ